ncbi:MAG: lysophospholipid acyltransferase family protein [Cytophagales bacterium]|nr:lysophospholipid acyltransferase family protein [Cytophagales bacterium]
MKKVLFYFFLPFLYIVSKLPLIILYGFSGFLYVLIYSLLGYRKKVVLNNLQNAFPTLSEEEHTKIAKAYYRYLCDLLIEVWKGATMTQKDFEKRCTVEREIVDKLHSEGKSAIFIMGHYGNWEWAAPVCTIRTNYPLDIIYKPMSNESFEKLFQRIRSKFGNEVTPMDQILRKMIKNRDKHRAYAFVADQTPSPKKAHWMSFLHQDTAVFTGVEKIAQKLNLPVVYISIQRPKRGYYHIVPELLFENPKETKEGEIMEVFMKRLEKDITQNPQYWLWSHKRWKHKRI